MVRAAFVAVALALCATPPVRAQAPPIDLISILEIYAHGRHDEAVARAASFKELGPLRLQFVQRAPAWVAADPASAQHRRAAVAGFVVELAAARLEDDWGRLSDLIEFTCAQIVRAGGLPTEFERSWHMATTALAGRARVRQWLLGPFARLPHQKPRKEQPDDPPSPKHLTHALERFPDDPQFQLARVVAWTWGRDAEPIRNLGREPRRPLQPPQLEALTALEPLQAIPAVASEAFIRAGLIHVTLSDHVAALKAFEAARPGAATLPLKYLSHFLAGRSLEMLNRHDAAADQYRAALALAPLAESATVALAGLHFMRGEHDEAVRLVDAAFAKTGTTTDPGRLTGYGAFLHWPQIKAAMRAEIPK